MPKPSLRDALVDAALSEFHQHGYSGAGVAGIASAAGAPKGSFYNHFHSKADLAIAAVDRFVAGNGVEMLDDERVPRALDRITGHFTFLVDRLAPDARRGCLLGNLAIDTAIDEPAVAAHIEAVFTAWSERLAVVIRTAQDQGDARAGLDVDLAADTLVALWEGVALRTKARADVQSARRQLQLGIKSILQTD